MNIYSDCKVGTGAHIGKAGVKTAKLIGLPGAWSLKLRHSHGLMVGCIHLVDSAHADSPLKDSKGQPARHAALCQHDTLSAGCRTRRDAIVLARHSEKWCAECASALEAATV